MVKETASTRPEETTRTLVCKNCRMPLGTQTIVWKKGKRVEKYDFLHVARRECPYDIAGTHLAVIKN